MNSISRVGLLSAAGLLITGGTVAGPAMAAEVPAADPKPVDPKPPQTAPPEPAPASPAPAHPPPTEPRGGGKRVLDHDYQRQRNSYYCAPAATRIALSTQGKTASQNEIADKLGTTKAGTKSADDTTRVLNEMTGGGYETTEIDGSTARREQVEELREDVVEAVDAERGVVANITGTAADTRGNWRSYEGGHYLTIIGYRNGGKSVKIADPYSPDEHYWMRGKKVASWIAERGYSS
ncbi:C39 family peptidase [Micromonospora sp. WMMD812]|uniref:C39 family peptidase n=1 Tax=Micromonospora sp. WMMD812 TaxID=3015152 RepID=UPI00248D31A8|nr:C39 family peptidase [Micromonospora sp. WMMD812]WBB68049.1 C39 family peptidase [Micromonospora sp. WMMD812]